MFEGKISSKVSLEVEIVCRCSLVGKKLQRKLYKKYIFEASLEFGLHFGHSNFNVLNRVKYTN